MIALGSPGTARLQAQIGEGLATVAERDFPEEWDGLVDVRSFKPYEARARAGLEVNGRIFADLHLVWYL